MPAQREQHGKKDDDGKRVLQEVDEGRADAVVDVFDVVIDVVHQVADPVLVEVVELHFDDTAEDVVTEFLGSFGLDAENDLLV